MRRKFEKEKASLAGSKRFKCRKPNNYDCSDYKQDIENRSKRKLKIESVAVFTKEGVNNLPRSISLSTTDTSLDDVSYNSEVI